MFINSDRNLDVVVTNFVLNDNPATITINLKIQDKSFFSKIIYSSIPSWQAIWDKIGDKNIASSLLGAVVAWDSMRFLALGGEKLILCEGLSLDKEGQEFWRYCFLNQFGEWRYRNNFQYSSKDFPKVICTNDTSNASIHKYAFNVGQLNSEQKEEKHLIANGGGKDTLVGMLLINDLNINYDVYEGYLPMGGSWQLQRELLEKFRNAVTPKDAQVVSVVVEDNFYNADDNDILKLCTLAKHYKTDFAVGHTANYPGYYPIIMYHEYTHIWFNIEASADRTMVNWNGESINHQWCKSAEYQNACTQFYQKITNSNSFKGFNSTIRGLYDTHIYAIAVSEDELIKKTHSCNNIKPWCYKCPKCCFSYLMLSSFKGEAFAMEVLGTKESLFEMQENREHWQDLLDPTRVAWECVPSHEECLLALVKCAQRNINNDIILKFLEAAKSKVDDLEQKYLLVKWDNVPSELKGIILQRILNSGSKCSNSEEVLEDRLFRTSIK